MYMFALVTGLLLVQAPIKQSERQPEAVPLAVSGPETAALTEPAVIAPVNSADGGFFAAETALSAGPSAGPTMPPIEDLPQRPGVPTKAPKIVLGGAKDRKPIAGGGAGFFDPGKRGEESSGSMIKLMMGIVVLGILVALGVPTFSRWTQSSQIRNAAEAIHNGLMLARAEAVRRNTAVLFQFLTTTTGTCALSDTGANWVVNVGGLPDSPAGACRRSAFRRCRAAHRPGSFRRRRFPQRRRQCRWGIADHLRRHRPGNQWRPGSHQCHQSDRRRLCRGRADALHARERRDRRPDPHVRSGARRR